MLKREIQLIVTSILLLMLVGCGSDQILTSEQEPDPVVVDIPVAFIKRVIPLDVGVSPLPLDALSSGLTTIGTPVMGEESTDRDL